MLPMFAVVVAAITAIFTVPAYADAVTSCTANKFCYCVDGHLGDAIDRNVTKIRGLIAQQKAAGKAIGYLSIPLSTTGGSYLAVNKEVAKQSKASIEGRLGPDAVWILNTGMKDFELPDDARGPDYMLMWTRVLEGDNGLGEDFDFIYFAGPSDFARFFSLDGHSDMKRIQRYYDRNARSDPELQKIDRGAFRNYYGLRASVSFSYGSHDEWNIVRTINEKRREANLKSGLATQLGVLFDGKAVAPGLFEVPIGAGNAKACDIKN
jgi:hypothetical protein